MRRIWIFFLVLGMVSAIPAFTYAQKGKENETPFGRKKKEKKNQRVFKGRGGSVFKRKHSSGNADQFAGNRISGKKGFFASIFGPRSSRNASLRKTKPAKKNEDRNLFKRTRTNAKNGHNKRQTTQNRKREKNRRRGNEVFSRKKR